MDHGYRSIVCGLIESRRWVWIFGISFAAVLLLFQFFKLPYESVLPSLLSTGKIAFFDHQNSKNTNSDEQSNSTHMTSNLTMLEGCTNKEHCHLVRNVSHNSNNKQQESRISIENTSSSTNPSASHGISEARSSVSISQMNELLLQGHSMPDSKPPQPYLALDEELLRAKSEIENVPLIQNTNNLGLYEPLYRNVSKFVRSYELMEKVLKVYVYKEGEKPIFHESILEGIYASEGWFIKLLESNNQFVTQDPSQAHLFFLPFSSRLLQLTLYDRKSRDRSNLILFTKNYVDMLIHKYPFWNRTNGEDHFLAACHDWAPTETRGKMLSCLRALCNADIKRGFVVGKDVSLPTVNMNSAKNPLKDVGNEPGAERSILAFFSGYMHGNVRPKLLEQWGKDPDMKILERLPHVKGNKNYIQYMKRSKYCICPRGFEVHSPRVVEAIWFECVPVIISDNYVPPFLEVLNWESFAVFVLEEDIPDLKRILMSVSEEKYFEMRKGVKEVQKHFLWHSQPVKYDLFHMILHSVWYNRIFRMKSP